MSSDGPRRPPAIDVEALMNDLRERIAEKKGDGLYAADDLAADLRLSDEPWDGEQLERAQLASQVTPGLITSPSESPIVGKALQRVKEQIVRASWRNMADLSDQLNAFHAEITAYATSLGAEVRRLRGEIGEVRAGQDGGGLATLEARIDRLAASAGEPTRTEAALDPAFLPRPDDPARLGPLLGREMASAPGGGCLIGCGTGELLDALGPEFTGVDDRAELAGEAIRAGRAAVVAEPHAHLTALGDGSLGAIVIRETAERLPVDLAARIVREARRVLISGGVLALIVRNYAAPAERETFWRDPWRLRPVEADTAAAMLAGAGFEAPQTVWVGDEESSADASHRPTARCAVVFARVS